jgi:hypothetical protein
LIAGHDQQISRESSPQNQQPITACGFRHVPATHSDLIPATDSDRVPATHSDPVPATYSDRDPATLLVEVPVSDQG